MYEPEEIPDVGAEAVVALKIDGALFLVFALPHAPVVLFLVSRSLSPLRVSGERLSWKCQPEVLKQ